MEIIQPEVALRDRIGPDPRQSDVREVMHETSYLAKVAARNTNLSGEEADDETREGLPPTAEELERMKNEAIVMIVDDELPLAKAMARLLRGFKKVSVFANPEGALAEIVKDGNIAVTPDLVISDCDMEERMSGGKFYLELQKLPFEIKPEFIAASGYINAPTNKESKRIFREHGVEVHLKPDFIRGAGFVKVVIAALRQHPRFTRK